MVRPMLSLVLAAVLGATQTAIALDPASAPRDELVAVGDYSYDGFYNGFRLSRLIDLPVMGADGKPIGKITDVTIGFPGELERVVIAPGAAANTVAMPVVQYDARFMTSSICQGVVESNCRAGGTLR